MIAALALSLLRPGQTIQAASGFGAGGAPIELRARFGRAERALRWQELATVVQWQDASGRWRDVGEWKGTLDEMVNGEGRKVWWVFQADLGKGPFRWAVYQGQSGKLVAQSGVSVRLAAVIHEAAVVAGVSTPPALVKQWIHRTLANLTL